MTSPERPVKQILVSVWYRGQFKWCLAAARKAGRHYEVSPEALNRLLGALNVRDHTTYTLG